MAFILKNKENNSVVADYNAKEGILVETTELSKARVYKSKAGVQRSLASIISRMSNSTDSDLLNYEPVECKV